MRYFWKIANRAFIAFAEKIFWESLGEKFPGKLFWGKSGEGNHGSREIFANGISWRGWKTIADVRGLGSFGNSGFGNLNIAKGCNRMVKRSRGHMGHIEGHFRDLFSVQISRKTFRKMGSKCPMCPPRKKRFLKNTHC